MLAAHINKALIKATKRSTHRRHQNGCVIVKNGKIISTGCAHASNVRFNELHSIHAEIHALGRGRHEDLSGAVAHLATIARKSGNFCLSKPCLTCAIALRAAGIVDVWYTVNNHVSLYINLEDDLSDLKVYPKRRK